MPNFGFESSTFVSFCCFQLGVFQLGAFSSVLAGATGAAGAAGFFQDGTFGSGVDGVELSGDVFDVTDAFHDGTFGGLASNGGLGAAFGAGAGVFVLRDEVAGVALGADVVREVGSCVVVVEPFDGEDHEL